MSLELVVKEKVIGSLAINYDELKQELALQLQQFKGLVVTEETITDGKKVRASLNKVAEIIDNRRKELKKEFLKPYELVESQAKELVGMINEVNIEIDRQIKTYDLKLEEEKKIAIAHIWAKYQFNKITLDQIWDERWLNKTYTLAKVEEDLNNKILEIDQNLASLKLLVKDEGKYLDLQAKYLISLDLPKTIQDYEREQAKKELVRETPQKPIEQPIIEPIIEENATVEELEQEDLYEINFRVIGTKEQIIALNKFMVDNKIKYQNIEVVEEK